MAKKALRKAKPSQSDEDAMAEIKNVIAKRFKKATRVYQSQDDFTKEVIDSTRDRLKMSMVRFVRINGKPVELDDDTFSKNLLFLACEIVADLGLLDIQLANFKFAKIWCAECKVKI